MLVKPMTSESHIDSHSSLVPTGSSRSYKGIFWKYWSKFYFYHSGLPLPSPEKVRMKEKLYVWFQGLGKAFYFHQ